MFTRPSFSSIKIASLFLAMLACGSSELPAGVDGGGADVDAGSANVDAGATVDPIPELANLDELLAELRNDRDAALLKQSRVQGWPAPVEGGYLFVSAGGLALVAGDHDSWTGTAMSAEDDFHWLVLPVAKGNRYKFTDGGDTWLADPWSRAYAYDEFGEMSTTVPTEAHLERFFRVGDANLQERIVRVWVPQGQASHLLYAHDGQNLFDPNAPYGGWKMNEVAPQGLMIVGIDFTEQRTWEYTYTTEPTASGPVGGGGDLYAAFVQDTVRGLVQTHYGEPARIGVIGSSFGGIMSLHMADRYPGQFDFVASLSGTVTWGSWAGTGTDTMIHRYEAAGHRDTAIYLDSGGNGDICVDSDGDGSNDDDPTSTDDYCDNLQFKAVLISTGYVLGSDLWYHWAPDALHNEAAWAARVSGPFSLFMDL